VIFAFGANSVDSRTSFYGLVCSAPSSVRLFGPGNLAWFVFLGLFSFFTCWPPPGYLLGSHRNPKEYAEPECVRSKYLG